MMREFIIRELEGDRCVVYGLDWAPLIGAKLDKQSLAHARRVKASHLVAAIEHSSSVGTVKLPAAKKSAKGRTLYSAGAVVALKHPTSAYLGVLQIEEDLVWIIATHNGSVIKGTDTLCSPAEAVELVESIRARYPNIADLDDTDVQSYLNDRTQLKPVHYGFNAVPLPARLLAIGALAVLVGNALLEQGSTWIQDYTRAHSNAPRVDPVREWDKALNTWAASTMIDGPLGYSSLLEALVELPTNVGKWSLSKVQCDPTGQRNWSCKADFKRGINATNESFLTGKPQDWKVNWASLDVAESIWQVQGKRHPLARAALPKHTDFSVDYISRLQDVSRAFTLIEVRAPVNAAVQSPTVVEGGERLAVEQPQGLILPKLLGFKMKGPLRSLASFPLNESTRITHVEFTVERNQARPDLRTSALFGEIQGEYYVQ